MPLKTALAFLFLGECGSFFQDKSLPLILVRGIVPSIMRALSFLSRFTLNTHQDVIRSKIIIVG